MLTTPSDERPRFVRIALEEGGGFRGCSAVIDVEDEELVRILRRIEVSNLP